jgi:hypothetical protein
MAPGVVLTFRSGAPRRLGIYSLGEFNPQRRCSSTASNNIQRMPCCGTVDLAR